MNKREILLAICEQPGWSPPTDPPSSIERSLQELTAEGWIFARLDGFEASPKALEEYPEFRSQKDIADPQRGDQPPDAVIPPLAAGDVTKERVTLLFYVLLKDKMTLGAGEALVATVRSIGAPSPADGITVAAARMLAEQLLA